MTKVFGPYSPIRQAGDMYFTAGQVGVNPKTGKASADVRKQTAQALENLKSTLNGAGLEMNDVLKVTLFVTDMSDFAAINEVYLAYFAEPRPARSTVGVKELPRVTADQPLKIEIEAIAAKGAK